MSSRWRNLLLFFAFFVSSTLLDVAAYQKDVQSQFDYHNLLQTTRPDWMRLSPDKQWLVIANSNIYPSIHSESNEDRIELLGREFYFSRPLEVRNFMINTVKLIHISTGHSREVILPERNIHDVRWSPDSKSFALIGISSKALDIWRYNILQHQPELWSNIEASGQLDSATLVWLPDSQRIILRQSLMLSASTLKQPVATLQIADSLSLQTRVYRNTLDTDSARQSFAALLRQQAVLLNERGEIRPLTSELLLESISVSPDGRYLLVQHFSDEVQPGIRINRLAREYQVIEIETGKISIILPKLHTDRQRAREPDAAAKGARLVQWQPNSPATLIWVESIEQRGHATESMHRDAVMSLAAPFQEIPAELFRTSWRLYQLFMTDKGRVVYSDFHAGLKLLRYWSLQLNNTDSPQELLQYDYTHQAESPGELVTQSSPNGNTLLVSTTRQEVYFKAEGLHRWGDGVYLIRQGATPSEQSIAFESNDTQIRRTPLYVRTTDDSEWLLVTKESAERAPSIWVNEANKDAKLVYDSHTKDLVATPKPSLLEFQRSDGVQLYSQLFLPPKETEELLPAVIWLYPREYHTHQQQPKPSQQSIFQAIDPMGPLVALLDGYAVVDASQAPIIRFEEQEPNDTFVQQQQQNISALIAALSKTNRIDTNRLVLMGHSYGAFSALSLLTERSDFRCAIARSGAYNRSLTPLGFQGEKRTLWQTPALYQQLSPFFHADKIKTPVLLVHGLADENPGTAPLQSEMMFQALQANQVYAKLLLLKKERHAYRYRETIEMMLIEQSNWLRECMKFN